MSSGGRRLDTSGQVNETGRTWQDSPHKVPVEKVGQLLLQEPQLVTPTLRYQPGQGLALLVRLETGELAHHTLQPHGERLGQAFHSAAISSLVRT